MPNFEPFGWLGLLWRAAVAGLSASVLLALLTLLFSPAA